MPLWKNLAAKAISMEKPGRIIAESGLQYAVMDIASGRILLSENKDVLRHPASLTKMLTLYLVFKAMRDFSSFTPQTMVEMPALVKTLPDDLKTLDASRIGEFYRADELMIAAGSQSDCLSTTALVVHSARLMAKKGDMPEADARDYFITQMNVQAAALGMNDTCCKVMIGEDCGGHYSTAADMCILIGALEREYPDLCRLTMGQPSFDLSALSVNARDVHTDALVREQVPGILWSKTGTLTMSGSCLGLAALIQGKLLASVVLGAPNVDERARLTLSNLEKAAAY